MFDILGKFPGRRSFDVFVDGLSVVLCAENGMVSLKMLINLSFTQTIYSAVNV